MIELVRRHIYLAVVIFVSLLVAVSSYVPGTYLSGWDTLHPEFNFWMYIKRIFFGVWQSHQGLGALASQAHPAELPRMIILGPLIALLPDSLVRYSYFYLALMIGPIGIYLLLKKSIFTSGSQRTRDIAAASGSLFYLLNLGTLQHFYVPFEMFATHFATIGFQFHFVIQYLRFHKRRDLFWFSIVTIFSTPMAHTATLWYANLLGIITFLTCYFLLYRKRAILMASGIILGLTVIFNLYWIMPNAYFAITKGKEVSSSKIHSLFTEEAFAQSASFGTLKDLALLKNFLFNWGEYVGNDRFGPLLDKWTTHLNRPLVTPIGYLLFILVLVGIFASFRMRNKTSLAFLGVFILCIFFWFNVNPPFGALFSFFRESLPIFREAFRFPFTKFSILLMCVFSIYFAWAMYLILTFLERAKKTSYQVLIFITLLVTLIYYMLPAFTGNMISRSMKVSFPKAYFSMFDWFKHQKYGRIASLPMHSFWGWTYNSWGYQGAGFLWFGIEQPLLDREFDRWSWYNEQYYREMSQAIYTKDLQVFKNVLMKYDISYVLVDKSILAPGAGSDPQILFHKEIESLIKESGMFTDPVYFSKSLAVYPVLKTPSWVNIAASTAKIAQTKHPFFKDVQFQTSGTYFSPPSTKDNTYTFSDLIDNQNKFSSSRVRITQSGLELTMPAQSVKTPVYLSAEELINADLRVVKKGKTLQVLLYPLLPDKEQPITPILATLAIPLPEEELILSINSQEQFALPSLPKDTPYSLGIVSLWTRDPNTISLYTKKPDKTIFPDFRIQGLYDLGTCGQTFDQTVYGIDTQKQSNGFTFFGRSSPICLFVPLERLLEDPTVDGSLLSTRYSFIGGVPSICLLERKSQFCSQSHITNFVSIPNRSYDRIEYFPLKKEISELSLQFFLDTTYAKNLQRASYENISFGIYIPKAKVTIDPFTLSQSLKETQQVFSSKIPLLIPFNGDKQLSSDLTLLPKTGASCTQEVPRIQEHLTKEIRKKTDERYIRYYSQDGSFCDHFSYTTLSHARAYAIIITSRNLKGLPLRMCITNLSTKRCDVYTHLTSSSQFAPEIFFLPKSALETDEKTYGYDINLNNYAVADTESINELASIQIVPFPDTWLQSMVRQDIIQLKGQDGKGIMTLSESFEPGWQAYIVGGSKWKILNSIKTTLPFLFGKKLDDHVVANGWANGWILSNDQRRTQKDQIVVFFLPQMLEYAGFLLPGLLFLLLFLHRKHNRDK